MTVKELRQAVMSAERDLNEHETDRLRIENHIDFLKRRLASCEQEEAESLAVEIEDWNLFLSDALEGNFNLDLSEDEA